MYLFFASEDQKNKSVYLIEIFYSSYVDMINVMSYDLYGSWTPNLGHHSALFHRPGEKGMERELNTVCY